VLTLAPGAYGAFLRPDGAGGLPAAGEGSAVLATRLIRQNGADLARLIADRDTLPPRTGYWNAQGQLWPAWVGVLSLLGAGVALWRTLRLSDGRAALALWLTAGLTAPLLLTSRVHLGRLLPALPLLLLLAGWGGWWIAELFGSLAGRWQGMRAARVARAATLAALVFAAIYAGQTAWRTPPVSIREVGEARVLADLAVEATDDGVTLVFDSALGPEIERVRAATYRLLLADHFRFDDLGESGPLRGDAHLPVLRFGDAQTRLAEHRLPHACAARYAVQPEAEGTLRGQLAAICPDPPEIAVLPR
ncbi:MAG: hypothetical protein IT337_09515, partial [Thermomicrobiales bacterium]|nr:hypothetical protein [Thermomicrobiales bacterium]